MKKKIMIFAAGMMLAACSSGDGLGNMEPEEPGVETDEVGEEREVSFRFSPYDINLMTTKAATAISIVATHLDVWLYEGDNVTEVHQSSADEGFGSVSLTLNRTKTYTMYAVAHKCAGDATLENGIVSFPDDKVTHSMVYTQTFTPATTTVLNCVMDRIVGMFRLETTDAVPSDCKKVAITISNVFDRWSFTDGGTHGLNRTSTLNVGSTNNDGTAIFNIYAIVSSAETLHDVTVAPLDADDQPVQTPRTFTDVPLRNGYKTTYRGQVFTDEPVSGQFQVDDWEEYAVYEF